MRFNKNLISRLAILLLASCSLSACEIQRAQEAADAKKTMIGMDRTAVLACMGSPDGAARLSTTEVWSYKSGNNRTDSFGSAHVFGGPYYASAFGSAVSETRYCKVDVVMENNRVTKINYHGQTGGLLTQDEQCAFAISACLQNSGDNGMLPTESSPATSNLESSSVPSESNQTDSPSQGTTLSAQSYSNWQKQHSHH